MRSQVDPAFRLLSTPERSSLSKPENWQPQPWRPRTNRPEVEMRKPPYNGPPDIRMDFDTTKRTRHQ